MRSECIGLFVCLAGCAVASVFGSGDYDRKKKKFRSSVWRVVLLRQFLVLAITTGKKISSSRLSGGLCYAREKKVPVVARAITTGTKKVQVVIKFVLVQPLIKTNTNPLVQPQHIRYI